MNSANSGIVVDRNNQIFDLFLASTKYILVAVFRRSSSKNFPIALTLAKGANRFLEGKIGGKQIYCACFSSGKAEVGRALAMLDYVQNWKGTQIFSQGQHIEYEVHRIVEVLDCLHRSFRCDDISAHCYQVIDDPKIQKKSNMSMMMTISFEEKPRLKRAVKIDRYLFPCKLILCWFQVNKDHPASVRSQIQALAVDKGCDWCPNFKIDNWKKVGERTELVDFFE